jgi:NAD(P)-dependent dehydrogenase (short-subunit alcohol dehydrogenase family)
MEPLMMPVHSPQGEEITSSSPKLRLPPLLAGRRAVVTGAAGGIGKAIADAFDQAGATVVRFDIKASGSIHSCDVADEASVARAFDDAAGAGPIDDVVHAAAIASIGSVADTSVAEFRRVLDVNLTGAFLVAREATRHLRRGGNLILIASQYGLKGWPLWGAYCASKAGVLRLTDSLVGELAPHGIRVNTISPGSVDTEMVAKTTADLARQSHVDAATIRAQYESVIPMGRFARPEEIASVGVALCSGLCSYVNGSNIVVDGGELSR